MSGRDLLLQKMRRKAKGFLIRGIGAAVVGGGLFVLTIVARWHIINMVILGLLILVGLYLTINGAVILAAPQKDAVFKKNPQLLRMADELYANIRYQDELVILSEKLFCPQGMPWIIVPLDEIYWVYIERNTMDVVPMDMTLWFVTGNQRFAVPIHSKPPAVVDRTVHVLVQVCPHLRVGHTPENALYADQMQHQWQQAHPKN